MTEQIHVPMHITLTRTAILAEEEGVRQAQARQARADRLLNEHRAKVAAERERVERWFAEAKAQDEQLGAEMTAAGRDEKRHQIDLDDAREDLHGWCRRHQVRPEDLPPLPDAQQQAGPAPSPVPLTPCVEGRCGDCTGDRCGHGCHAADARALIEQSGDPEATRGDIPAPVATAGPGLTQPYRPSGGEDDVEHAGRFPGEEGEGRG